LTKQEVQAILLARYEKIKLGDTTGNINIEIWQQNPRTDVKVCLIWRGIKFCEVGFASMNYKDTWDAEYGVDMAIRKAIANIAKRIARGCEPFARIESQYYPSPLPEVKHVPTTQD